MVNFQLKYWYTFKDLNNNQHKVEILEDTLIPLTALEIRAANNPFILDFGSVNKFDTVFGSGADLNLVSHSNMFFFKNLYTNDMKHFQVKHYINNLINWIGYINSELFRETFTELENYDVQLTANDGFSLMDRIMFLDDNKNNFTGLKSYFDLFQIIFNKVGLPFSELRISCSTTFEGYTESSSANIFQQMKLNCENFYDEDNKSMTLRNVLDEILKPFQCFIFQKKGNIYINDYNNKATLSTIFYKCYSISNLSNFLGTISENNIKVLSKNDYQNSGGEIGTGAGINRQVVSYSGYKKTLIADCLIDSKEFSTIPNSYSIKNGYNFKILENNKTLTAFSPAEFEESYFVNSDTNDYDTNDYIKFNRQNTSTKIAELKIKPFFNIRQAIDIVSIETRKDNQYLGCAIKITGEILIKTKSNPYDDNLTGNSVVDFKLQTVIGCTNNKYSTSSRPIWRNTLTYNYIETSTSDQVDFSNKFTAIGKNGAGIYIPISSDSGVDNSLNGEFIFEIWSDFNHKESTTVLNNSPKIQEVWIKNLKIELVDIESKNSVENKDKEYIATLDSAFKNEGSKINLKVGTDSYFSDKAKLLNSNGYSIFKFNRGNLINKKIEELLLNSIVSNFKQSNININGLSLKNDYDLNNIITSTYFTDSKFCITNLKTDYANCNSNISLTEIFSDNLTI